MRQILRLLSIFLFITPLVVFAGNNTGFKEGKDYKLIQPTGGMTVPNTVPKNKVQVIEFFNYGCPWCYELEPTLEKWLKTQSKVIEFQRVPVIFEPGWSTYAKAYYTAKALGVLPKMTPLIFNAIHKQGMNLTSAKSMEKFFVEHGVSKTNFESAFDFAPGIGMEVDRSNNLMRAWQVYRIPTFVIDGKYKTNTSMSDGSDSQLMKIVTYLVNKEAKAKGLK